MAVSAVRDAATRGIVVDAYLVRPTAYVALAPMSNVLDTLTLLSVKQHVALLLGALVLLAIWRGWRRAGSGWRRHLAAVGVFLVAVVALYVAGAVLPRPMASLVSDNANILIADFHSHTDASHDGRQSLARNRRWHQRAGYGAAYITDHRTVEAAERALAGNPPIAAEGVMLLQGIEVTWDGEHVGILSAERTFKGLLLESNRDLDPDALRLASLFPGTEPVLVWHHPHDLSRLPVYTGPDSAGVSAIEIKNGAPDDMDEMREQHADILALARAGDLALTSGSDNHGWGYVAPAWTLLRIEGWRGMNSDVLATSIENTLRFGGFEATRVVERRVADPGRSPTALVLSVFTVPARMLSTLTAEERGAWLVWIWAIAGGWWWMRRRGRHGTRLAP